MYRIIRLFAIKVIKTIFSVFEKVAVNLIKANMIDERCNLRTEV